MSTVFYNSTTNEFYGRVEGVHTNFNPIIGAFSYIPIDGTFLSTVVTDPSIMLGYGTWNLLATGTLPTLGIPVDLVLDVTGILPVANGGSGVATAFTPGSVLFAGASGVYSQDNTNFFWDDSNNRLGIGTASPLGRIHTSGSDVYFGDEANTARALFMRRNAANVGGFGTPSSIFTIFGGATIANHINILSSGFVGINQNAPIAQFHIHKAAADSIEVGNAAFAIGDFGYGVGLLGQQTFSAPYSFVLQVQSSALAGATYPLSLNPRGGTIYTGNTVSMHTVNTSHILKIADPTDTSSTSEIRMFSQASRYSWQIGANVQGANILTFTPSTLAGGSTFSNPALIIDETGKIGIGIINPAYRLVVSNNGAESFEINPGGGNILFQAYNRSTFAYIPMQLSGSDIQLQESGITRLYVAVGGNIGIGELIPTAALHLKAGTATANTAPLKFNASTLLTTPEIGAVEFVDNGTTGHLYVTVNIAGTPTRVQIV